MYSSDYIGNILSALDLLNSKWLFSMQALYLINMFILGTCNYEASISSPLSSPYWNGFFSLTVFVVADL